MRSARSHPSRLHALLLGAAVLPGAGCGGEVDAGLTIGPDTPVVVVVIDTLRADRLSHAGYALDTSPFLDEFASQSFVFEANSSQCNSTFPSLTSIFTGVYPKTHQSYLAVQMEGAGDREQARLQSLAERLDEHGYYTVAAGSHPFWGVGDPVEGALWRGWDSRTFIDEDVEVEERPLWAHARHTNERLFAQLDEYRANHGADPLFLWAHYFDPHTDLIGNVYAPPEEHRNRYLDHHFEQLGIEGVADQLRDLQASERRAWIDEHFPGPERFQVLLAEGRASYDAEIRAADDGVRRLFERLRLDGVLDRAVVVVMADHGENMDAFLEEHQAHPFTHARLYEGVIHVPLLIHLPGQTQQRRIGAMSQSIDVLPTLLDLLGLPPNELVEGRSLVPLMRGDTQELHHVVYSESSAGYEKAVRSSELKLIDGFRPGHREVYEWRVDHDERADLAGDLALEEPAELVAAMQAFRPEVRLQVHVEPMDQPFELSLRYESPGAALTVLEGLDGAVLSEGGLGFEWSGVVGPEGLSGTLRVETFHRESEQRWSVHHGGRKDVHRAVLLGRTPINETPAIPVWRPVDGELPRIRQVQLMGLTGGTQRKVVVNTRDARHIEYELRYRTPRHDRRVEERLAEGFAARERHAEWMYRADAYDTPRARAIVELRSDDLEVLELVRIDGRWPNPGFVSVDGRPVATDELEFHFPCLPLDMRIPPYLRTQPAFDALEPGAIVIWRSSGEGGGSIDRGRMSPELIEQLRALGYLGEDE